METTLGSFLSVQSYTRAESEVSAFQESSFGNSMSLECFEKFGSVVSIFGSSLLGSSISVFSSCAFGSSLSIQSLVQVDSFSPYRLEATASIGRYEGLFS